MGTTMPPNKAGGSIAEFASVQPDVSARPNYAAPIYGAPFPVPTIPKERFIRARLKDSYSNAGRPSIDPELLLRMLLIGCLISVAFILSISLPWELGNPRRFGVRFLVVPECGVKAKRDDWLKEMAER